MELVEQFRGCLFGLVHGASLGEELEPSRRGTAQFTMTVLDSYNARGAFNPQDIAEGMADVWRRPETKSDRLSARALQLVSQGYSFERASQLALLQTESQEHAAPECLPRVIPAGLLHYYDDLRLIGESRVITGITHPVEICKTAAVVLNLGLQHMLLVGIGGLLEELVVFLERRSPVAAAALAAGPAGRVACETPAVLRVLRNALWTAVYSDTVQEGFARAMHQTESPATSGAIAGALLGARFGIDEIARVADRLNGAALLDLADRVYRLSQRATLPEPPQARLAPDAGE
jgi:ADP-ribosyl-[dinitrogen reductase] hydrolase